MSSGSHFAATIHAAGRPVVEQTVPAPLINCRGLCAILTPRPGRHYRP